MVLVFRCKGVKFPWEFDISGIVRLQIARTGIVVLNGPVFGGSLLLRDRFMLVYMSRLKTTP
jgi:hypothetical protein